MDFSFKKLPKEASSTLRMCPLDKVKPYQPLSSPGYLYFHHNEKFVSIKAPLDFFTPEELKRLAPYENIFFLKFEDTTFAYRDAGFQIKTLLELAQGPVIGRRSSDRRLVDVALRPTEYELSDATLRLFGPLWGEGLSIEPLFVAVAIASICAPLDIESLQRARNRSMKQYEYGLLLSAWVTFLALHLGYVSLSFLNELRSHVFKAVAEEELEATPPLSPLELQELVGLAMMSLPSEKTRRLTGEFFSGRRERVAQKLASRFVRVQEQMIIEGQKAATVFGEEGFLKEVGHG